MAPHARRVGGRARVPPRRRRRFVVESSSLSHGGFATKAFSRRKQKSKTCRRNRRRERVFVSTYDTVSIRPGHVPGPPSAPPWIRVPGTRFIVDGFQGYGKSHSRWCANWFLTHFHADHYKGLTKSTPDPKRCVIWCSRPTAELCRATAFRGMEVEVTPTALEEVLTARTEEKKSKKPTPSWRRAISGSTRA